jgi:hypothetical protein
MIIKSEKVSDYEGFKSLTSYDEAFTSRPSWVDVNQVGTYINKVGVSYKVYHCVQDNDMKYVWHKLHSITISSNNHLLMDVSTMMALYSIEDDLTDDLLKDAVRKIRNVKP